jgi:hypothetical protein
MGRDITAGDLADQLLDSIEASVIRDAHCDQNTRRPRIGIVAAGCNRGITQRPFGQRLARRLRNVIALVVGSQFLIAPVTVFTAERNPAGASTRAVGTNCSPKQLAVSVTQGIGGAGHFSSLILVHNNGPTACPLKGYPEVRLLNADGTEAGEATERPTGFTGGLPAGAPIPDVDLKKGDVASAVMEGTDVPIGGATSCPSFPSYTITLPGWRNAETIDHSNGSCSGLYVHPFVIGFNGTFASGEVEGPIPACRAAGAQRTSIGPFVQVEALKGSFVAGMVTMAASPISSQHFQIVLRPGRYAIESEDDHSTRRVTVRAGETTYLGLYGSCYQVTTTPTTVHGSLPSPTTSTTT